MKAVIRLRLPHDPIGTGRNKESNSITNKKLLTADRLNKMYRNHPNFKSLKHLTHFWMSSSFHRLLLVVVFPLLTVI